MGPIGVRQLPRTWWKTTLRKAGLLDVSYSDCSRELDSWVLQVLELDKEKTLAYIRDEVPTYLQFEVWVVGQKGGTLDQARVDRWNEGVENRVHVNPGKIDETYPDIGLDFSKARITSAVVLNAMQDWGLFHKNDLMSESSDLNFPIAPLISSLDVGPLGVFQLARTWLKVLMRAKGVLRADYPDFGGGLDLDVLTVLGLDKEEALDYLRGEMPTYLQFETWISDKVKNQFDRDKINTWHNFLLNRIHPGPKRADIHQTIGREDDGNITRGVMLNHLEDWAWAHQAVTRR